MLFARRKRQIVRLLVVEDEPLIAFDTEHLLRDASYRIVATVDRVSDAVAAIESNARAEPIDLVLVDITLSDGSGITVAQAARVHDVAVLFVTGHCPPEAEAFGDGCLTKPYTQRDLLSAIEAVEGQRLGRQPRRLPSGFRLFPPAA